MGGMGGMGENFGLHAPSTRFQRTKSGQLIAIIPLPRSDPAKLAHSSVSADIRGDGDTLHVRASLGSKLGQHMRSESRIALRIPAVSVVSASFDSHGNARVLLQPKPDADLSDLELESDEDAAFSLAKNTSEHQLNQLSAGRGNGNLAYAGNSYFALWQAAIFGAFIAVLGLVILQWTTPTTSCCSMHHERKWESNLRRKSMPS